MADKSVMLSRDVRVYLTRYPGAFSLCPVIRR
jgi:hypothetical protein